MEIDANEVYEEAHYKPIDKPLIFAHNVLVSDTYTRKEPVVMKTSVKDIIRRRKSARTFRGESLRSENKQKLDGFLKTADNPFDIPIEFRGLDVKKYSRTVMPAADNRPEYIMTCEVNH